MWIMLSLALYMSQTIIVQILHTPTRDITRSQCCGWEPATTQIGKLYNLADFSTSIADFPTTLSRSWEALISEDYTQEVAMCTTSEPCAHNMEAGTHKSAD